MVEMEAKALGFQERYSGNKISLFAAFSVLMIDIFYQLKVNLSLINIY